VTKGGWALTSMPDSFTILVVCDGSGTLEWSGGSIGLERGNCFLLPADLGDYSLNGEATVLRCYLP
jgi:mannose-6-phosphate isomerase